MNFSAWCAHLRHVEHALAMTKGRGDRKYKLLPTPSVVQEIAPSPCDETATRVNF